MLLRADAGGLIMAAPENDQEIDLVPLKLFSQRIAEGWTMVPGYPLHARRFRRHHEPARLAGAALQSQPRRRAPQHAGIARTRRAGAPAAVG